MAPDAIPAGLGDEILALTKRFGRANWDALNRLEKIQKLEKMDVE